MRVPCCCARGEIRAGEGLNGTTHTLNPTNLRILHQHGEQIDRNALPNHHHAPE